MPLTDMTQLKRYLLMALLFSGGLVIPAGRYLTLSDIKPVPESLLFLSDHADKPQLTDRYGEPISVTYINHWNTSFHIPLYHMPPRLKTFFIYSEDKRFFEHGGIDWYARFHAVWQNIIAGRSVRGASTITEQVIRMIHPRPRTVWSRWIEGFEAAALEKNVSKNEILEFYLNQVPYASNRRGVGEASLFYFNRTPDTLTLKEMAALAVLVRAPSAYDLYRNPGEIEGPLKRYALKLLQKGHILKKEYDMVLEESFELEPPGLLTKAPHFADFIYKNLDDRVYKESGRVRTTLDGSLQNMVSELLNKRLKRLSGQKVINGACLVSDHTTGEILAWVSAAAIEGVGSGENINAVLVKRQPGSSMKPFLYTLALEKGWTAATLIEDRSLTNPVGRGLHTYHNYSRLHYGKVTLRQALGNSLNIPAVKAIRFTGVDEYLHTLRLAGINSLDRHSDFYGDGLALGNGEVTLFEMVQAYNVLADRGRYTPLQYFMDIPASMRRIPVYSGEAASITGNILSDPEARSLEFGSSSILNFPVQTAVKTGTSSDYRDAWAVGYNYRYSAGVWMGNLDGRSTDGITGSKGPALVLRSIFALLNKKGDTRPLYLSPQLVKKDICTEKNSKSDDCAAVTEFFIAGTEPSEFNSDDDRMEMIGFIKPVNGLEMAMDPRIPDNREAFEFVLRGVGKEDKVSWIINGKNTKNTKGGRYLWALQKGIHVVEATVQKGNKKPVFTERVRFTVK